MYYLLSASASLGMGYGPGCIFIRFRGQLDIITRVTGKSTMENGDDCDQRAEEQLDYVTSIKRGKPKIIDGGYAYVNDKNGLGTVDWR